MIPWPWPAPDATGRLNHLVPGTAMPDIAVPTHDGSSFSPARLSGRHLVLVYPWTGGPGLSNPPDWDNIAGAHGSTAELIGFRNLILAYRTIRVGLVGLSTQAPAEQATFAAREGLPFPLACDHKEQLTRALGLPTFEAAGRRFLHRVTLVIRDGAIEHVFDPVHPPDSHAREMVYWASATEPKRADGTRGSS